MNVSQIAKDLAKTLSDSSFHKQTINLQSELRLALENSGSYSQLQSTELAEEWWVKVRDELESWLLEWDYMGIPRPLSPSLSPTTFLTIHHPHYTTSATQPILPAAFPQIMAFLAGLSSREFLLPCACLLQIAGCDPILISDGPRDGGVDCIGRIQTGATRSLCLFVQSKTSVSTVQKQALQLEIRKFEDLQKTATFTEYVTALGTTHAADGRALCYLIAANNEFAHAARRYAVENGLLLRSLRQMAFLISQHFTLQALTELRDTVTLTRDLQYNLAPKIRVARLST